MRRIFYNQDKNLQIDDVSGLKTKGEILEQYNLLDCQEIEIDELQETVRIIDGKLTKYNYKEENAKLKIEKEEEVKNKKNIIKQKLNLSDEELKMLKEVL